MSLLLLDRANLEVRAEGDTLVLYEAGARRGTVPIKLVERCVVHGAQTLLSSGVLLKLAEAGVSTVLMSPRVHRRVAVVLGPQHNDAAVRLAQAHRVMDDSACRHWSHSLVSAKLQRQQRALQHLLRERPDARKPLWDALQTLAAIAQTMGPTTQTLALDTLRGKEGAAARAYFGGLAGVMPPALEFTGRNRRPPRDPVNVCLSLGYTLLHSQAIHACQTAGLDPLLGFYHRPTIGRESLASDLIEPLRPTVDLWVWELLRNRTLREDHFNTTGGACLLGKAGRAVFYATWERTSKPLRRWLRLQTRHLASQLRNEGLAWIHTDPEPDGEEPAT